MSTVSYAKKQINWKLALSTEYCWRNTQACDVETKLAIRQGRKRMILVNEDKKKRVIKETDLPRGGKNIKNALKKKPWVGFWPQKATVLYYGLNKSWISPVPVLNDTFARLPGLQRELTLFIRKTRVQSTHLMGCSSGFPLLRTPNAMLSSWGRVLLRVSGMHMANCAGISNYWCLVRRKCPSVLRLCAWKRSWGVIWCGKWW